MKNWLIISNNIIVGIIQKNTNIVQKDFNGKFDTVQDDPSKQFKVGDIFSLEKWLEFNPQPVSAPMPDSFRNKMFLNPQVK